MEGKVPVKRNRYIKLTGATKTVDRVLEAKIRAWAGIKGYTTNLASADATAPSTSAPATKPSPPTSVRSSPKSAHPPKVPTNLSEVGFQKICRISNRLDKVEIEVFSMKAITRVVGLAALTTLALTLCAAPTEATPGVRVPQDRCTAAERTASLAADQQRVLAYLGHLRTVNSMADVAELATLGGGYGSEAHGWVQYQGIGVVLLSRSEGARMVGENIAGVTAGMIKRDEVTSGRPFGLLYRARNRSAADVGDPFTPKFPYDLVGWIYSGVYTPGVTPTENGLCLFRGDWGLHERGVHALPDFHMVHQMPAEPYLGADPGSLPLAIPNPLGLAHPRIWDTHVWIDPKGPTPMVDALDPVEVVPGADGGMTTAFPYPVWPDSTPAEPMVQGSR